MTDSSVPEGATDAEEEDKGPKTAEDQGPPAQGPRPHLPRLHLMAPPCLG